MHAMVYVIAPDEATAKRVSLHLLQERLVACSNVFPVRSYYWWEGEIQEEPEYVAVMKTRGDLAAEAVEAVRAVHPYEVPCAVAYEMAAGSPPYLEWIDAETRRD